MLKNISVFIQKVSCKIVIFFSMIIVGFLAIQDLIIKVRVAVDEEILFSNQKGYIYILFLIIFLCVLLGIRKYWKREIPLNFIRYVTMAYIILMIIFVFITQMEPRADQYKVLHIAGQFAKGNYIEWSKGQYADLYPNQYGMIVVMSFFSRLWGNDNWLPFQIINIFLIVSAAFGMKKITYFFWKNEQMSRFIYLIMLLYIPLGCYVTFVYGTLPGLNSAIWGCYFVVKGCEEDNIFQGVIGSIFVAAACIFKSNYLICFLGICIVVMFYLLKKKKASTLLILVALVGFYALLGNAVNWYVNIKVGHRAERGIPSIAWVAMGLQETEGTGPGWYNAYTINLYSDNDCNREKSAAKATIDVGNEINQFISNLDFGKDFFYRKIASEWNEATFQSVWINNELRNRSEDMPEVIRDFLDGKNGLYSVYVQGCGVYLFVLWIGILLFLYFERNTENITSLLWLIIFIGGFLFHLVWEAKGQYTLIYVWLCIPYGIHGYVLLMDRVCSIKRKI